MDDNELFKRLNYFTGFFTTAEDWNQEQAYHLRKRRYHNRGLHTPGVVCGERDELAVEDIEGSLTVKPGAALDHLGRYIYLPEQRNDLTIPEENNDQPILVVISYQEEKTDHVTNLENDAYSGDMRWREEPVVAVKRELADGDIELARITLDDNGNKKIDRSHVAWAGPVGRYLISDIRKLLDDVMQYTRVAFGNLADRFPNRPSEDARQVALSLRFLASLEELGMQQLTEGIRLLYEIEGEEVLTDLEWLGEVALSDYKAALEVLKTGLDEGEGAKKLLDLQQAVAVEANDLAEMYPPTASAGADQAVVTHQAIAQVILDASGSQGELAIEKYSWNHLPMARAGEDQTALTAEGVAGIELDAGDSQAFGQEIESYRWDEEQG